MKRENTIKENVEFLLSMYKRELEYAKKHEEEYSYDIIECYENSIIELQAILDLSK